MLSQIVSIKLPAKELCHVKRKEKLENKETDRREKEKFAYNLKKGINCSRYYYKFTFGREESSISSFLKLQKNFSTESIVCIFPYEN